MNETKKFVLSKIINAVIVCISTIAGILLGGAAGN